jgi:predicted dehydrogenase
LRGEGGAVKRWRTVLVGCGRIGAAYADDAVMARHYRYVSHAQVLAAHPGYDWVAAVDRVAEAARQVAGRWSVPHAGPGLAGLHDACAPEVAVLAMPPGERIAALDALPGLRAVIVEKPLGASAAEAQAFLQACERRGIAVQVNLPRRADATHRALAGELDHAVGRRQGAFLVYGNGVANNGTHMIDLARWFMGEVTAVQAVLGGAAYREGPLDGDFNLPFALQHADGVQTLAMPVAFAQYRENMVDIWGERGRVALLQEGLRLARYRRDDNRAMAGEHELANDAPAVETTTIGDSLYAVYDNLWRHLDGAEPLASTGANALRCAAIVDAIRTSLDRRGEAVPV